MTLRPSRRPRQIGVLTDAKRVRRRYERRGYPYAVGDRIAGDLTVIGHLAAGRLGHLYQVWSAREWAAMTCKILAPEHGGRRSSVAAFRRESKILKRLHHPNLVRRFGGGEHDGLPYILLEYLEGPSVFEIMESRPDRRLEVADAVRVALNVGAAIRHLHRVGYLHLDLKPANLLLRGSVPVLIDFDAARRIDPDRRPRAALGTSPYMAPEQVELRPLGPATDVYGLGAVLYEMVTGRWPFEAVYTQEEPRSGIELEYPQLGSSPPPDPAWFNAEISPTLNEAILRCLRPDPADRFPELHSLLLVLVDELPEPVSPWPEGVRAERRRAPRAKGS